MTLTDHPVIASMRAERDVEHPVVEVPALDTHVVEDGDVMEAEFLRAGTWACHCIDGRHRDIDREELAYADSWLPFGAHRVPVFVYAVVGAPSTSEEIALRQIAILDAQIERLTARRAELLNEEKDA